MHGVLVHHQSRHTARLGPLRYTHAVPSLGRWRVGCCSKEVSAEYTQWPNSDGALLPLHLPSSNSRGGEVEGE